MNPNAAKPTIGIRLTLGGILTLPVLTVLCLSALNSEVNLLYLMFAIAAVGVFANVMLVRAATRRLTVRRILPTEATAGRPAEVRLAVTNGNRRFNAYALGLEDHPTEAPAGGCGLAFLAMVPAGGRAEASYRIVPARRGRLQLADATVRTRFPFGLARAKCVCRGEESFLVWPQPAPDMERHLSTAGRDDPQDTPRVGRRIPGNDDFAGLREYRRGDSPRMIHWRSTARMGRTMVRENERRPGGSLLVVLDTRCDPTDEAAVKRREAVISAAAGLVEAALARDWSVAAAAWSGATPTAIPPGRVRRLGAD